MAMLHQDDQGLPHRPTSRALPSCLIEFYRITENGPTYRIEECVGDDEIARRIANACAAEVDHGTELALLHQKIAGGNIAMDPHRRSLPRRCKCRIPDV